MLVHKIQIPQSDTIFTHDSHMSSLKYKARIMKAKMLGYKFSKMIVITVVAVGLLSAGSFQVFASNNHSNNNKPNKTVNKITKTVKARAGNNTNFGGGGSNNRASVDNSVHVNTGGGGGGGSMPSINRNNGGGNHKNNNGNDKKKVVRKKVVRKDIDKSYTDTSYTDNSYKEVDISVKQTQTNECGDCYNTEIENNYRMSYPKSPSHHRDYDKDYTKYEDDHSYQTTTRTNVINNNNNENNNDNRQYMDVSFPTYYEEY